VQSAKADFNPGGARGRADACPSAPMPPPQSAKADFPKFQPPVSTGGRIGGRIGGLRGPAAEAAETTTGSLADYARTAQRGKMHGIGGITGCARATCTAFRPIASILQQEPTTQPTAEPAGGDIPGGLLCSKTTARDGRPIGPGVQPRGECGDRSRDRDRLVVDARNLASVPVPQVIEGAVPWGPGIAVDQHLEGARRQFGFLRDPAERRRCGSYRHPTEESPATRRPPSPARAVSPTR
jgi:hypothetical protein